MLRPEKMNGQRKAQLVQSLMLQVVLAVAILIAAFVSRDRPFVFWLTLSLLAIPVSISVVYLRALSKMKGEPRRGP